MQYYNRLFSNCQEDEATFHKIVAKNFHLKISSFSVGGYGGIVLADVNAAKLSLKTSIYLHATENCLSFYITACPVRNNFSVSR